MNEKCKTDKAGFCDLNVPYNFDVPLIDFKLGAKYGVVRKKSMSNHFILWQRNFYQK